MLRRALILLALVAAISVWSAAPSFAANAPAVSDCSAHGRLTQHYSVTQLRTALATMPADVQEYTNCYNVIQDQMLAQIPGHHGKATGSTSSGSSSFLSTPLLVALIVLLAGGGALGGVALQRRNKPPGDE